MNETYNDNYLDPQIDYSDLNWIDIKKQRYALLIPYAGFLFIAICGFLSFKNNVKRLKTKEIGLYVLLGLICLCIYVGLMILASELMPTNLDFIRAFGLIIISLLIGIFLLWYQKRAINRYISKIKPTPKPQA